MRTIVVQRLGGPDVLAVEDRPTPEPGEGQLLVDVAAAGVNFMDIYQREGKGYALDPPFPLGQEGAGTVTAVGPGVTTVAVGERVAWASAQGSYAEQALVPADRAIAVPAGVDLQVAAAALLQGMTAHYLAASAYPVRAGDVAVVHAAAGGVGLLLTQLVKSRGGVVVATTSDAEKGELARQAGVERGLADPVVHNRGADPGGDVRHGRGQVVVTDDAVRPGLAGQLALLRVGGGSHDHATAGLHQLGEQQTDAAGRGVHDCDVPGPHRVGAGGQVVRGHPLQQRRGRYLQVDAGRYRDRAVRRHQRLLGVAALRRCPGHPFADRHSGHPRTDRRDRAGTFLPERERRVQRVALALPLVDVHKAVSYTHLPLPTKGIG